MTTLCPTQNIASTFAIDLAITKTYQEHADSHPALREAAVLAEQFPAALLPLRETDSFAGRYQMEMATVTHHIGFLPQTQGSGCGYFCNETNLWADLEAAQLDAETETAVRAAVDFWRTEKTDAKIRAAYSPELAAMLPSDEWLTEAGPAFPLYRMAGSHLDYTKLIAYGIPGLRTHVSNRAQELQADGDKNGYASFTACAHVLETLSNCCIFYADQAAELAQNTSSENRENLLQLRSILLALPERAPHTAREALQLMYLYCTMSGANNFGRMDIYTGPLLLADLEHNRTTEERTIQQLCNLWELMAEANHETSARIVIGGEGRPDPVAADAFAALALEATYRAGLHLPQLSLRICAEQNPALYDRALDCLGAGRTFPILYNDDINIPSVMKAFNIPRTEAIHYVPYGCGEYVLADRSMGTPSGLINMLAVLDLTLRNGYEPNSHRQWGPQTGHLHEHKTFASLMTAYRKQVEFFIQALAEQEALEYQVCGEHACFCMHTMLYDDCIARGKAVFSGGLRYLGGTMESYGQVNTADALHAIRTLIYDEQSLDPHALLEAIDANFDGFEPLHHRLKQQTKYGNDEDNVDALAAEIHEHLCLFTQAQAKRVGLHNYLVVVINNSANTLLGRNTPASADGRMRGTAMANGNNPASGMDKKGVTAFLNSLLKMRTDIHAGAVQNMKFSKSIFSRQRPKLEVLLDTYFKNGGAQAMLTVVNPEDLIQAQKHPERYQSLIVRVGGFSARFVELDSDVQGEILARTLND